jgi:hypothetical protein
MSSLAHHRWAPLRHAVHLGSLVAIAGACLTQSGCQDEDAAQGSARSICKTTYPLDSQELVSITGTYGTGCRNRSGTWSLAFTDSAVLDHPELSVMKNDVDCYLTLTALSTTHGLMEAMPTILLAASYQATPSVFGSPVDFYANAKLSSDLFAADFVVTILYSDAPNLAIGDNTAIAIPPTVIANSPSDNAVDVSIARRPTATFSVAMDPATITNLTFTLRQGETPVDASVSFDAATRVATLSPWTALALGLSYEARVTIGARDTGDTPLAEDFFWTFATALCSQASIDLGTASSFAVLAASTATNTGPTVITGNVGVSPGTAVTGFPPGTIHGTLHLADSTAAAASVDMSAAYDEAQARTVCPTVVDGDIGGQILTPGLYRASSSLAVSSDDLTLDALGEEDAVFVFQIGSTLTVSSNRRLILVNGARSTNVYWLVGSSATLEVTCDFAGTILADQSITMGTGAILNGRAMARAGAVTMDSNTISEPGL